MKLNRIVSSVLFATLSSAPLWADFTYEQTTEVTGGALLSMMKFAGAFSKDSRKLTQPMPETVSIKGNRMLRKSPDQATIIDADQQTITTIDFAKRSYSVMTFEQMKQQMAAMQERMRSGGQNQPSFDVKINDTGKSRSINGADTHEVIVTMIMSGVDPKSGNQGAMNVVTDSWIAPSVTGYGEARELHRLIAEKLGWEPGGNALLNRPDVAKSMAELYKNGAKLDGMPMANTIKMGADVQNTASTGDAPRPASQPAQNTAGDNPLASALAGRFGLGRSKKKDNGNSGSDSGQPASGALIEMNTQVTSYNSLPVDEALFQVPAGFTKVEPRSLDGRSK